jgi:hypothetical protein
MTIKHLSVCALACVAAALGGCAGLSGSGSADLLKQLDANFATCDRHITFQAGVGVAMPGAAVSGSVDCKGNSNDAPAAASAKPAT